MARPKKELDWSDIDKLCGLQCTQEEIAWFSDCSVDTLERRCVEDHQIRFAEYYAQKRGIGKISLRRRQWQAADAGNITMLIWLGKQYLQQTDKLDQTVQTVTEDRQKLLEEKKEELRKLYALKYTG